MSTAPVPSIISVDDHVIEPPDVWQSRLPARFRERGPKVVRLPWKRGGGVRGHGFSPASSGPETDFWQVEDIYVAIPKVEVAAGLAPEQVTHEPISFAEMRPGTPHLKLAFSESQMGWMPYVMERMDRIWRMGNAIAGIDPAFVNEPSSYMAGRVFGCFFEDDYGIANRDVIGIDHITFESDYPHQDSSWPHTHDYLTSALSTLSEEDTFKIARGNAIRMLDLELDPELPVGPARKG